MEKIVFLDCGTLPVPLRRPSFPHVWAEYDRTKPEETVHHLQGATIAITNKVKLQEKDLLQLSALRLIAVAATGFDCVDVATCRARGIGVANVPGYTGSSVPEHVFALLLALKRNLIPYHQAVEKGEWKKSPHFAMFDYRVESLSCSTLGLVGYGQLAREVEKRARAFEMEVLVSERKGTSVIRSGRVPFEDVLRKSDVVSLHAPLTPETKGLLGERELALMKKSAILINTARGGLIDEQALAEALRSGQLGGAGLDVLSEEPPQHGNPLLDQKLPNLIVTPHVGWTSVQALKRLAEDITLNMESFVAGVPRNRVA